MKILYAYADSEEHPTGRLQRAGARRCARLMGWELVCELVGRNVGQIRRAVEMHHPDGLVVEATDTPERAKLFHGMGSRLKVNQDLGLADGVNNFGSIDLRRRPAKKIVFKFFCRRGCDAAEWPVFVPTGAVALTVGIDVRDPTRAWLALLADIILGE